LSKDAGRTWKIVYENEHPQAFIDGMKFWDDKRGFVFGDPIDERLMALRSDDRGQHWLSSAQQDYRLRPGEAGFAASNSSLMVFEPESVWIGLGGASGAAQVLISDDGGLNWIRSDVESIPGGKSSGIFSLARGAQGQVVAVGGDYMQADGKTVLLATHQIQFLKDCDIIVVMDGGKIKASGTYSTLASGGFDVASFVQQKSDDDEPKAEGGKAPTEGTAALPSERSSSNTKGATSQPGSQ
jgi:photosystem II stability/assembly factor-like uncharacterized protein